MKEEKVIQLCQGFWNCISPDAWVQSIGTLIGSFLGALIAGGIAIYILNSQLRHDTKKDRKSEYNSYMKFNEQYQRNLSPIMGNLGLIKNHIQNEDFEDIKSLTTLNIDILQDLMKIDTNNISHSQGGKVNLINRDLQLIMFQLSLFVTTKNMINISNFENNLQELTEKIGDFKKYEENFKKEIGK